MKKALKFSSLALIGGLLMPGVAQAKFCPEGGAILNNETGPLPPRIEKIREVCKPGDTIMLPSDMGLAIGAICDFTKQIYRTSYGALCVLNDGRS